MVDKQEIVSWLKTLQDNICVHLEGLDQHGKFREDQWERPQGGGGRTRIIEGANIEKGGVNFSAVHGPMPDNIAKSLGFDKTDFFATGVSIVLHAKNPFVPIIHMNVRYFEAGDTWWFGGGIDLTPIYIQNNDASYFHSQLKDACDKTDPSYFPKFKKWADDYFYVRHRKETRGIGGIFYDRLGNNEEKSKEELFGFMKDVGNSFSPIYQQLFLNNVDKDYDQQHIEWQRVRRGRYVEFNLVWDRGTKFGLETDGRIESILMSLPPQANWKYNHIPNADSEESKTLSLLKKGIDWVNYKED